MAYWELNPSVFVQSRNERIPDYVLYVDPAQRWKRDILNVLKFPILWVRNPVNGIPHVWELSPEDLAMVRRARQGAPSDLSAEDAKRLQHLGVLVDPETQTMAQADFEDELLAARKYMRDTGYAVIKNLLLPGYHLQIRAYFDRMWDRLKLGDYQVKTRKVVHNNALCRVLHFGMQPVVQAICPEPIKPSYCFLGLYLPDSVLKRHTDRPQCRWNVSLVLDSKPEVSREESWPIFMEGGDKIVRSAHAAIGDAVMYRGIEVPHWREKMPAVFEYNNICFFHFVNTDFEGELQ